MRTDPDGGRGAEERGRRGARRRFRVEGTDEIEEGFGRKVLFERGGAAPPHEVLLCRVEDRLHALHSLCPHAGGRLAEGPLADGRHVSCPLHLYKFDPRTGASVEVECEPATVYPVEERDGAAWVELDLEERPAPPPQRDVSGGKDAPSAPGTHRA